MLMKVINETLRVGNVVRFLHRKTIKDVRYKGMYVYEMITSIGYFKINNFYYFLKYFKIIENCSFLNAQILIVVILFWFFSK